MPCDRDRFWGQCPRCNRELWLRRERGNIHCVYCDQAIVQRQTLALAIVSAIAVIVSVLWLILAR